MRETTNMSTFKVNPMSMQQILNITYGDTVANYNKSKQHKNVYL